MTNEGSVDDLKLDTLSSFSEVTSNDGTLQPDSLSTDIELDTGGEGSMDLREITQSILDLEDTQNCSQDFARLGCQQIPSSPPPSYEHVLAETKLEEEAAALAENIAEQPEEEDDEDVQEAPREREVQKGVEIMHKSHKEFYRAVAKQWGITCKMSDHCRCLDCQSMYFECEYDQNEQEKTDGGLGAGTPMFISEVMHGSACTLL